MSDEAEVDAAATALLDAFAANDRLRYFAAFTPDATFIFPIVDHIMLTPAAYAAEWQRWIDEDNFKITECLSSDRIIKIQADTAIFIHGTITRSTGNSGETTLHERETIIFHKINGRWLAAHEHVSPLTSGVEPGFSKT